jgi:hypothetical protein
MIFEPGIDQVAPRQEESGRIDKTLVGFVWECEGAREGWAAAWIARSLRPPHLQGRTNTCGVIMDR